MSKRPKTQTRPSIDAETWDAMILDARKKILELEYSITVFERRKALGEESPCGNSTEAK